MSLCEMLHHRDMIDDIKEDYLKRDSYPHHTQRINVVNKIVIHHSAGDDMKAYARLDVELTLDEIGRSRTYAGQNESGHYSRLSSRESFVAYHYVMWKCDSKDSVNGWRIEPLIWDILHNTCWHAGRWDVNESSIGVCVLGDYTKQPVPYGWKTAFFHYFKRYRDHLLRGGEDLKIYGHKEISDTACPGALMSHIEVMRKNWFK